MIRGAIENRTYALYMPEHELELSIVAMCYIEKWLSQVI